MVVKGQAKEVQGTDTHHIETDHLCVWGWMSVHVHA